MACSLVFWTSRLIAGAAAASLALNVYSIIKRQSFKENSLSSVELADGLSLALYDVGVLAGLATGLALLGPWLITREDRHQEH